jgi:hypothetical protein
MPTFEVKIFYIDVDNLNEETGLHKHVLGCIYVKEERKDKARY